MLKGVSLKMSPGGQPAGPHFSLPLFHATVLDRTCYLMAYAINCLKHKLTLSSYFPCSLYFKLKKFWSELLLALDRV